jgi:hypothetical protein
MWQHGPPFRPFLQQLTPLKLGNGRITLRHRFADQTGKDRELRAFAFYLYALEGIHQRAGLRDQQ